MGWNDLALAIQHEQRVGQQAGVKIDAISAGDQSQSPLAQERPQFFGIGSVVQILAHQGWKSGFRPQHEIHRLLQFRQGLVRQR